MTRTACGRPRTPGPESPGSGSTPGFLIHDGLHCADIEGPRCERAFDRVRRMEARYGPRPVGGQSIVTTITPPPAACDGPPFARLTLDARSDPGTLLGARW